MGWHSDARKNLKKNGAIASVSFGAERIYLQTQRQQGNYPETYPRQLVSDETETKLTGSTAYLPLHALLLLE
jgi:hypothetical protein